MTGLVVWREAERFSDILDRWGPQRSRECQEIVSLMSLAEYCDSALLWAFVIPAYNYTVCQDGVFGQPGVAAFDQETVVMLGNHFDQYLHGRRLWASREHYKHKTDNFTEISCPCPGRCNCLRLLAAP